MALAGSARKLPLWGALAAALLLLSPPLAEGRPKAPAAWAHESDPKVWGTGTFGTSGGRPTGQLFAYSGLDGFTGDDVIRPEVNGFLQDKRWEIHFFSEAGPPPGQSTRDPQAFWKFGWETGVVPPKGKDEAWCASQEKVHAATSDVIMVGSPCWGQLVLTWLNQDVLVGYMPQGTTLRITGKKGESHTVQGGHHGKVVREKLTAEEFQRLGLSKTPTELRAFINDPVAVPTYRDQSAMLAIFPMPDDPAAGSEYHPAFHHTAFTIAFGHQGDEDDKTLDLIVWAFQNIDVLPRPSKADRRHHHHNHSADLDVREVHDRTKADGISIRHRALATLKWLEKDLPPIGHPAADELLKALLNTMKGGLVRKGTPFGAAFQAPPARGLGAPSNLWDTIFSSFGWNRVNETVAWDLLKGAIECQAENGMIPRECHVDNTGNFVVSDGPHPPLMAWAVWQHILAASKLRRDPAPAARFGPGTIGQDAEHVKGKLQLAREEVAKIEWALPRLLRAIKWWGDFRRRKSAATVNVANLKSRRHEAAGRKGRVGPDGKHTEEPEKPGHGYSLLTWGDAEESAMPNSPRFHGGASKIIHPVDLATYFALECQAIANLGELVYPNDAEYPRWAMAASIQRDLLFHHMWDEKEGAYIDVRANKDFTARAMDLFRNTPASVTPASMLPLLLPLRPADAKATRERIASPRNAYDVKEFTRTERMAHLFASRDPREYEKSSQPKVDHHWAHQWDATAANGSSTFKGRAGPLSARIAIPTVPPSHPSYSLDRFQGPMWTQINFLIYSGLKMHGQVEAARRVWTDTVMSVAQSYCTFGTVFEFYDSNGRVPPTQLKRGRDNGARRGSHSAAATVLEMIMQEAGAGGFLGRIPWTELAGCGTKDGAGNSYKETERNVLNRKNGQVVTKHKATLVVGQEGLPTEWWQRPLPGS